MIIHNRQIIPGNNINTQIIQYGEVISQEELWADGSSGNSSSGYTWSDGTTGHSNPKDNTVTYPTSYLGLYHWGFNIFPQCFIDNTTILLLDKNSNELTRATLTQSSSGLQSMVNGSESIQTFNAIKNISTGIAFIILIIGPYHV